MIQEESWGHQALKDGCLAIADSNNLKPGPGGQPYESPTNAAAALASQARGVGGTWRGGRHRRIPGQALERFTGRPRGAFPRRPSAPRGRLRGGRLRLGCAVEPSRRRSTAGADCLQCTPLIGASPVRVKSVQTHRPGPASSRRPRRSGATLSQPAEPAPTRHERLAGQPSRTRLRRAAANRKDTDTRSN